MIYTCLGIIVLCVLCFFIGRISIKKDVYERKIKVPTSCDPEPDCVQAAKDIGRFIMARSHPLGMRLSSCGVSDNVYGNIIGGKSYELIEFLRICHHIGCEVVIRQIDTQDIESPETAPKVLEEYICNLRRERR